MKIRDHAGWRPQARDPEAAAGSFSPVPTGEPHSKLARVTSADVDTQPSPHCGDRSGQSAACPGRACAAGGSQGRVIRPHHVRMIFQACWGFDGPHGPRLRRPALADAARTDHSLTSETPHHVAGVVELNVNSRRRRWCCSFRLRLSALLLVDPRLAIPRDFPVAQGGSVPRGTDAYSFAALSRWAAVSPRRPTGTTPVAAARPYAGMSSYTVSWEPAGTMNVSCQIPTCPFPARARRLNAVHAGRCSLSCWWAYARSRSLSVQYWTT